MEDLVERLARGNVAEAKVVLASVALALAVYQLVLIGIGAAELEALEERQEQRLESQEERREEQEERQEARERDASR